MRARSRQMETVLSGYAKDAATLIPTYDSLSSRQLHEPVETWLPDRPATVLDLGAGTGRDAAWLCQQGHQVWAVEPVSAFRQAGQILHSAQRITWVDDQLPSLSRTLCLGQRFDLIIANAVLHHLCPMDRNAAMQVAYDLMAPKGRLICSLRHGPTPSARPGYPVSTPGLVCHATTCGLKLCAHQANLESHQPNNRMSGVSWDWLVFVRE
ncbi:class I SAM-dependent methyltransferase [Aliisedimentitalea scapharcae]|uniref:Class I SAM-dependent methyltransferase n=1 Tax=Aliisedimentitalea scapharcae TaxID=1524259 RepID=A0ABZ2XVS0_9RHOB